MRYADCTFKDPNPIKSWLQKRRLISAIRLSSVELRDAKRVLDFGAGNGELCKFLAPCCPEADIICFEAAAHNFHEAIENVGFMTRVQVVSNLSGVEPSSVDVAYSLEVFEHLPPTQTTQAFESIRASLRDGGTLVIGVPVEIGIPALYKGLFRISRRHGQFDATLTNVLRSVAGVPPQDRPTYEYAPGLHIYPDHVGFDFRAFKKIVRAVPGFRLSRVTFSPFRHGGALMPEIYFKLVAA